MRSVRADHPPGAIDRVPERPNAGSSRPRKASVRTSHLNKKDAARRKASGRGDRKGSSQNGDGGAQVENHSHLPWPIKELLSQDSSVRKEVRYALCLFIEMCSYGTLLFRLFASFVLLVAGQIQLASFILHANIQKM